MTRTHRRRRLLTKACAVAGVLLLGAGTACRDREPGPSERAGTGSATTAAAAQPSARSGSASDRAGADGEGADGEGSGFVAFGDFGGGPMQDEVAAAMAAWSRGHPVDALVTTGDNVYPSGDPALFDDYLDEPYAALRASRPFWVTLGNHDVQAGHGDEQLEYLGLPPLPYVREIAGLRLLFLDGNRPTRDQAEWLDARLSEPGPDLRVVVFHQPPYSCSSHGPTRAVLERWVPVIEKHDVELVLSGHDHLYEHFRSEAGVDYVVTGGGGRDLYPFKEPCQFASILQGFAEEHHFTAVEVDGPRLAVTVVSASGETLDAFSIST